MIANYERLVLSASLLDRTSIYTLAPELSESNFGYGPGNEPSVAHRLIYRAMLALYQEQKHIDIVTVAKKLGRDLDAVGGDAYLREIASTMSQMCIEDTRGLPEWMKIVDNAGRLRHAYSVLGEYRERLDDIDRAVSRIENVDKFFADLLNDIGETAKVLSTYKPFAEACAQFRRRIDAGLGGAAVSWLPMGWESTKRYRLLPRSSLVTVMGLSSSGKSQLLAQFLLGAAIQLKMYELPGLCILNTYEMKGDMYAGRMASCLSGVDLLSPQLEDNSTDEYNSLMEATEFLESLPIRWDEGDMTSQQIVTQSLALSAEAGGIHVVGVDYSELVPDTGPTEEQRVAQVFKNCQRLSRKLDASVIVLSQVSGEAFSSDTRIAGPWGTRYSKSGWFASDIELELYNPLWMKKEGIVFRIPDYLPNADQAYILVHKNKNGPTGRFALSWEPEIVRFSDPNLMGYGMGALYENLNEVWQEQDF